MLRNRRITLLDPTLWPDKNDTYFLERYREEKKAQSLLVVCFAEVHETYHHWKVFSDGENGVRVEFEKEELLRALERHKGIIFGPVRYEQIKSLRKRRPSFDELPFLKRYPFEPEKEFRVIYTDQNEVLDSKQFEIPLGCIRRVTLSPLIPVPLFKAVKETLLELSGCERLAVYRSTLLENERWKDMAKAKIKPSNPTRAG
jgi:hypothetical protein